MNELDTFVEATAWFLTQKGGKAMSEETSRALVEENQALRLENTELRIKVLSYEREELMKRSKPMFLAEVSPVFAQVESRRRSHQ